MCDCVNSINVKKNSTQHRRRTPKKSGRHRNHGYDKKFKPPRPRICIPPSKGEDLVIPGLCVLCEENLSKVFVDCKNGGIRQTLFGTNKPRCYDKAICSSCPGKCSACPWCRKKCIHKSVKGVRYPKKKEPFAVRRVKKKQRADLRDKRWNAWTKKGDFKKTCPFYFPYLTLFKSQHGPRMFLITDKTYLSRCIHCAHPRAHHVRDPVLNLAGVY